MSEKHQKLDVFLFDLETALRQKGYWSAVTPSAEALESTKPFCVDTLTFVEWLQFVFIEKLRAIIRDNGELPSKCEVAPMAEEHFRGLTDSGQWLSECLARIDAFISES